jgi:hypothetical protein
VIFLENLIKFFDETSLKTDLVLSRLRNRGYEKVITQKLV